MTLLARLIEFAHAHPDQIAPAYYVHVPVRWEIRLHTDGTPTSAELDPVGDPGDPVQARGVEQPVPSLQRSGTASKPFLAADQIKYVLGWAGKNDKPDLIARHHQAFKDQIDRWHADTGDPVAAAISTWYRHTGPGQINPPKKWASHEYVTITVDGTPAHTTPSAITWWTTVCQAGKGSGNYGFCLVCGQTGQLLRTIPQHVKGLLVPGAARDAALISVNAAPHGWRQATQLTHTPICEGCGTTITSALSGLLADPTRRLGRDGDTAATIWWQTATHQIDLNKAIDDPSDASVGQAIHDAIQARTSYPAFDPQRHYSLTIAGNISRIAIHDWLDIPLAELATRLSAWIRDVTIHDWNGPTGIGAWRLVLAAGRANRETGRYNKLDKHDGRPHGIREALVHAAITGSPVPAAHVIQVLGRINADYRIDAARAVWARLHLNRAHPSTPETPMSLDPTQKEPAYLAGRLHALYENLQQTALGKGVNTTFGDKWRGHARAHPAAGMAAGAEAADAWFAKLRKDSPGLAIWYDQRIGEVVAKLQQPPPAHATVTEQCWWVLGYHHQRTHRPANLPAESDSQAAEPVSINDIDVQHTNHNESLQEITR